MTQTLPCAVIVGVYSRLVDNWKPDSMSTLKKMAEARKAAILSAAHKQAAEIDREMEELERLATKYNPIYILDNGSPKM